MYQKKFKADYVVKVTAQYGVDFNETYQPLRVQLCENVCFTLRVNGLRIRLCRRYNRISACWRKKFTLKIRISW
jgi:hypothetical protein